MKLCMRFSICSMNNNNMDMSPSPENFGNLLENLISNCSIWCIPETKINVVCHNIYLTV